SNEEGSRSNELQSRLNKLFCTHWNFGPGVNLVRTNLDVVRMFVLNVYFKTLSSALRFVLLIFGPLVYKENLGYLVNHLLVSLILEKLGFEETLLKLKKLERSL
ncbi:hypothetical protein GIB67_020824, partial [Kingdonia uniflora]